MSGFVWIIIIVAALAIDVAVSLEFMKIADMKGHDGQRYFWWCFFLLAFGSLMVIALPDRNAEQKSGTVTETVDELPEI